MTHEHLPPAGRAQRHHLAASLQAGHPHGPGRWSRLAHTFAHSVAGAHSITGAADDSGDRDADAHATTVAARRALIVSLVALTATAAVQAVVVVLSGSVGLLGDTVHNVADALTAVPLLVAFTLARRPPTKRFTYGYGRAEDLAGLVVVAVIAVSGVLTGAEAVDRLLHPRDVSHLWAVAGAALIGFAGNETVARYRIVVGRRIGSAALVADGLHARTDGFASLAVLVGAAGAAAGWQWADPAVGLLITVVIVGVLRSAVGQVGARLMDAVDPRLVDQATAALKSVEGVDSIRELRIRWIGHTLRAEADLTADPALSIRQAHELAHHAEQHLLAYVRRLTAATIHISPAGAHADPG